MAAAKAVEVMVEAMAKASRRRGLIEYWRRDPGLPLVLLVVTRSPSGGPAALLERYSIAASLPCARLARRAEVDARRARGGAGTAALGFAVATREVRARAGDSAPPLRFEGGAGALALAPAACCFGALSATVHYARARGVSAAAAAAASARTSDRAATARPGPRRGSRFSARAPPNADAAAANATGPSAAAPARQPPASSSSSSTLRALPGRLAPGRRRAAPPGPRSFDPANRATPGGASPGARTGRARAPFGLRSPRARDGRRRRAHTRLAARRGVNAAVRVAVAAGGADWRRRRRAARAAHRTSRGVAAAALSPRQVAQHSLGQSPAAHVRHG
ncbi:hypothetical protein SO694_00108058 [Aureococcus anophagefferens]|uniref:HORMA domain-containing protein n=1 Tax=Aureococcus anophagefferens TaxID=44056 RepID=A0ABR1FMA7_AURAN